MVPIKRSSRALIGRHIGGDLDPEDEIEALAVASRPPPLLRRARPSSRRARSRPSSSSSCPASCGATSSTRPAREVTDCVLGTPGMVAMPYARLDAPSPSCVQALSTTVLLAVDMSCIDSLLKTSLGLNKLYISILQDAWEMHWEVERISRQCTARERYLWFLEKYPGMEEVAWRDTSRRSSA